MNQSVVVAVSVLAAVLAIALLRQRRLRLALEALVLKLVKLWRNTHADRQQRPADSDGTHVDRDHRL